MLRGVLALALGALCFAGMAASAKMALRQPELNSLQVVFFRFITGFVVIALSLVRPGVRLRPKRAKWVLLRAAFNIVAVITFFTAIQYTSLTKANLLNQTSPIWIFAFAPLFVQYNAAERSRYTWLYLACTLVGVYLVIFPNWAEGIAFGDAIGALSGILAGFAISFLHQARHWDGARLILFYQFGIGSLVLSISLFFIWQAPTPATWAWLIATGLFGAAGQYTLTYGYRFIDARRGSLVSASQVLYAAILGVLFFGEELTTKLVLGAALIMLSLVGVSGLIKLRGRQ